MVQAMEKKMKLLTAAGIIAGYYSGSSLREIYGQIIANYEKLLGIMEDPETASELAKLMDLPAEQIKEIADSIITRLLFNKSRDPFISLGLRHDSSLPEAHHRWKRLIVLYHPDRQKDSGMPDDRAKRINEAFAELSWKKRDGSGAENNISNIVRGETAGRTVRAEDKAAIRKASFRRAKYIPFVILGLTVMLAISMLAYCISRILRVYSL